MNLVSMAANQRSLRITDAYQARLKQVAARVSDLTAARWDLAPSDFDGSYSAWRQVAVEAVSRAQRENLRLTNGYLAAFVASETGRRIRPPVIDSEKYVGKSRDGRDLSEAWDSTVIKAKVAISKGKTVEEASDIAKAAAQQLVSLDTWHGARGPLSEGMTIMVQVTGFVRVPSGESCGACLAAADGTVFATDDIFQIHAECDCVAEPEVEDVPQTVQRPTGAEMFNELTPAEQAARVGDGAAEAIQKGRITLSDLLGHSPMVNEPDWITQRPLADAL